MLHPPGKMGERDLLRSNSWSFCFAPSLFNCRILGTCLHETPTCFLRRRRARKRIEPPINADRKGFWVTCCFHPRNRCWDEPRNTRNTRKENFKTTSNRIKELHSTGEREIYLMLFSFRVFRVFRGLNCGVQVKIIKI